jgi:GTP-binding protein
VVNKIDALDREERAEVQAALAAAVGAPVMAMSGVSSEGVTEGLRAVRAEIEDYRVRLKPVPEDVEKWHP